MRGISFALALSSFAIFTGHIVLGQGTKPDAQAADPTVTTWTKEKIDNPPARKIEFEVLKTAERRKLFRADAKPLEHKFVAQVSLQLPKPRTNSYALSLSDAELRELVRFGNQPVVGPRLAMAKDQTQSESLKRYLERVPKETREKLDELEFFASEDTDQGYLLWEPTRSSVVATFLILARTQEEAQRRATTLLALLDHGVTRPVQHKLLEQHEASAAQYKKVQEDAQAAEAALPRLQQEALDNTGLASEMLGGLRLQQFQLDVDVGGIKARLAACDERLKADPAPELRAQLESLKLSAEIELAGCDARRVLTDKFVERITTRNRVAEELSKAQLIVNNSKISLKNIRYALFGELQLLDDYKPLSLVDGKVIIRPIEWTQ